MDLKTKIEMALVAAGMGLCMWAMCKWSEMMHHRDELYAEAYRGFLRDAYNTDRMLKEKAGEKNTNPPATINVGSGDIPISPRQWSKALAGERQNDTIQTR